MMPDKVYVVPMKTSENQDAFVGLAYELDNLLIDKTEYIRKDALLEWLNERYKSTISNVGCYTGHSVWAEVIEHLNEM